MNTRFCNLCSQEKDFSLFSKDSRAKTGYQSRCKECQAAVKKDMASYYREKHLQRKYGISHADYENMLAEQKGCCAVCGIEEKYCENQRLAVDHDHATGEVRALLCKKCNQAIGLLQDSAEFAYAAYQYLKEHKND